MREKTFVYIAAPVAAVMYCTVCLGWNPGPHVSMLLLSLTMFVSGALVGRKRAFTVCCMLMAAAAALSYFSIRDEIFSDRIRSLRGSTIEAEAVALADAEVYDTQQRAELLVEGEPSFKTMCYFPLTDEPLLAGDRVNAHIVLSVPLASDGFDRASFHAADGRFLSASCALDDNGNPYLFTVDRSGEGNWRRLPSRIARYCKHAIKAALPEREAGLLIALLIGDRSNMSDDDELSLRIAGLSHLTAVSGLHVGFIVAFCYMVLGRRIGTFISIPIIMLFVPIAGATPSVLRAALMYLVTAGAFFLHTSADTLNSLCFALVMLLIWNPYSIASMSLQLSFTSTLGLVLFAEKLQKRIMEPIKGLPEIVKLAVSTITGAVSCTVCASMLTAPILLTSFGCVSVLAVISNLLTVGVTAVCFIGGFVFCMFSGMFAPVARLTAFFITPLLSYILWISKSISTLPFGRIDAGRFCGVAALFVSFAAVLLWVIMGSRVRWKIVLPTVCVTLISLLGVNVYHDRTHYTVTYLPCGSGQSVIVADNGRVALIDCGGDGGVHNAASSVREWMRWHCIEQIDTIVLTALDKTHARNLPELMGFFNVDKLLVPDGFRETKHNSELISFTLEHNARVVSEEGQINNFPITVFPVTEGKLGVMIGDHTLVLHSPTQKQLAAFLEDHKCSAPHVVLSERNIEDDKLLSSALESIGAKSIMLQSGWSTPETLAGLPVESPRISGEIQKEYLRE